MNKGMEMKFNTFSDFLLKGILCVAVFPTMLVLADPGTQRVFNEKYYQGYCHSDGWAYGIPANIGATTVVQEGVAYDVTSYGWEFGYHCESDQGTFVYTMISGDFDVKMRIANLYNDVGNQYSEAGLMVRKASLAINDPFVGVSVASNINQQDHWDAVKHGFVCRPVVDGSLFSDNFYFHSTAAGINNPRQFPNEWVRLKRVGNTYYGFVS